jgi:dTDP-4-dehydrorhamnose reductase
MREIKPDVVVNAAAYTSVDQAESEPVLARRINALAPGVIAEELQRSGGLLVHYSTDYVFDGTKPAPYTEEDKPNPISAYGASKLEGEQAIQQSGVAHMILRTSWVYGARGSNFLLTMLRLFRQRPELKVVNDQIGAPTWCRWIARSTVEALLARRGKESDDEEGSRQLNGIFHLTAGGTTSWFGFACAIGDRCFVGNDADVRRIFPIATVEYPLPARRPLNSTLSNVRLASRFGLVQPTWESLLDQCMAEVREHWSQPRS